MFKVASQDRVAPALHRVAEDIGHGKVTPREASARIHRVLMALSQTAQQAVQAMGPLQAGSREDVIKGFKSANPSLSDEQLEEIADHWEENKDVVKDKHASTRASFKAASQGHVVPALQRIANDVEGGKVTPKEATSRIHRVLMALSQTAQQAVQAMGQLQASSREEVIKGFKSANPSLSDEQLEEIADHWEENKDVVKDKHASKNTLPQGKIHKLPGGAHVEIIEAKYGFAAWLVSSAGKRGAPISIPDSAKTEKDALAAAEAAVKKTSGKSASRRRRLANLTDSSTLSELLDMEIESVEGDSSVSLNPDVKAKARKFEDAVEKTLTEWVKTNMGKLNIGKGPLAGAKDADDVVSVMMDLRGGASYLYFMEHEGHGVGTWDGDWDPLFVSGDTDELSKVVKSKTRKEYQAFKSALTDNALEAVSEDDE